MSRSLPISLAPSGDLVLHTTDTTEVRVPPTLEGLKIICSILARPAGRFATPGTPTQWDVDQMRRLAKTAVDAREIDADAFLRELGLFGDDND